MGYYECVSCLLCWIYETLIWHAPLFSHLKCFNKQRLLQLNDCEIYHPHLPTAEQPPNVCYPAASSVHTDVFTVECLDRDPQSIKPLCTYENKLESWQIINFAK